LVVLRNSFIFFGFMLLLSGCQVGYLLRSAGSQISMLNRRVPLEKALQDPKVTDEQKRKLRLAAQAKQFAEAELGLKQTKNYSTYVDLGRPYVTWVVSAAPAWELKHHLWHFPIVGEVPYKGFFSESEAAEEEKTLRAEGLDTYTRGVSAYSTLGWFRDPILSSMLNYSDHGLVNTIIHETVHATLYIESSADFNERLATFLGNLGAEAFYIKAEGVNSPTVKLIHDENQDEKRFSEFITGEISALEQWYKTNPEHSEETRQARLKAIQTRFASEVLPKMTTDLYKRFPDIQLNNARLLIYKTYVGDMADMEKIFVTLDRDYGRFLALAKKLEGEKNPESTLKGWREKSKEDLVKLIDQK
jgi:predicted aminopeptidase